MPFDKKKYMRKYRKKHKEEIKLYKKDYRRRNKKKLKEYNEEYYRKNKDEISSRERKYREAYRLQVLTHYGGNPPKCTCCGETEIKFLTIDHVNNDGAQHRKSIKIGTGWVFYRWLVRNGFPEGFQVLCANCNFGKRMNNGVCPHEESYR